MPSDNQVIASTLRSAKFYFRKSLLLRLCLRTRVAPGEGSDFSDFIVPTFPTDGGGGDESESRSESDRVIKGRLLLSKILYRTPIGMKLDSQASTMSNQSGLALDIGSFFWQQWQQYRDYLYRCCVKWMSGSSTDAEDALSRVMLKAWEKAQKHGGEIANFKAWLTALARNLCVDIHRENNRGIRRVESIEAMAEAEGEQLASNEEDPILAATRQELDLLAKNAIDKLPPRLREVFIPYYYQEQSYQEIAQEIGISYANVCKRISQARAILKQELRGYVKHQDIADSPSPKGGKSQETMPQPPQEIEVLVSVGELEEVLLVAGEIRGDTELLVPEIETVIDPAESEEETGENRGDDSAGNQGALLLSNHEVTAEYIRGAMSRMGCVGAVCLGERKKAIIAWESAEYAEDSDGLFCFPPW